MSFLDLYHGDQDQAAKIQPNEGARLPSGFDENFHAAWSDGLMFSQSVARENARAGVLGDYLTEIKQKTGNDLSQALDPDAQSGTVGPDMFAQANARVAKLKENYPDLDLAPLSNDEIDKRALEKARAAHKTYETLQQGEKTWGGSFGTFTGSAAAGAVDPINIIALPIAPEAQGIGILGTALRWGALAGVSQAAIEFAGDGFKEQVQPGYTESGEPIKEIAGAFLGGAVVGGSIKALGNAWTRVKTGQWPTSVRDAGNVIESEANIAQTNPLTGTPAPTPGYIRLYRGEHPSRNVENGSYFTTDREMASGFGSIKYMDVPAEDAKFFRMPGMGEIYNFPDYAAGPSKTNWRGRAQLEIDPVVTEVAHREALVKTIDDILAGRPVDVGAQITPELQRAMEAERVVSAAVKVNDKIYTGANHLDALQQAADELGTDVENIHTKVDDEKHTQFDAWVTSSDRFVDSKEAARLVNSPHEKLDSLDPEFLRQVPTAEMKQMELPLAPETEPMPPKRVTEPGRQPLTQTADEMNKTLTAPDHQDAIRADIDRERAMGDVQVPGVDENGNHTMTSVDKAMDEVDAYKAAAEQIQACASPPAEEAE